MVFNTINWEEKEWGKMYPSNGLSNNFRIAPFPRFLTIACVVIISVLSIVFTSFRVDNSHDGTPSFRRLQGFDAAMAGIDGPVTR